MEWIDPYMDEISFVLKVFAGLTLFWILYISVQWIRLRRRGKFGGEMKWNKVPTEITIPNIESVTLQKRPDVREYLIRLKLKD